MSFGKVLIAIFFTILFLGFCGARIAEGIEFGRNCEGHLKRAADANTIELAIQEVGIAISYLEDRSYTSGYTSILYTTPSEDIGYWYVNLKSSLDELKELPTSATPLEKSNMLMKLRETILDYDSEGVSVTSPRGISIYPNNVIYCLFGGFTFLLMCVFWIALFIDEL